MERYFFGVHPAQVLRHESYLELRLVRPSGYKATRVAAPGQVAQLVSVPEILRTSV